MSKRREENRSEMNVHIYQLEWFPSKSELVQCVWLNMIKYINKLNSAKMLVGYAHWSVPAAKALFQANIFQGLLLMLQLRSHKNKVGIFLVSFQRWLEKWLAKPFVLLLCVSNSNEGIQNHINNKYIMYAHLSIYTAKLPINWQIHRNGNQKKVIITTLPFFKQKSKMITNTVTASLGRYRAKLNRTSLWALEIDEAQTDGKLQQIFDTER